MNVLPRRAEETGVTLQTAAPMFAASPALEIVVWNEGAQALLGFTQGEVIGRRCHEVVGCPVPTRRIYCNGAGAWGCGCAPAFENEIDTRSGERLWVRVIPLLAASGGGPPLRVHLLQELRRQRQLEELLRQVVSTAARLYCPDAGEAADGRDPASVTLLRGITEREREVIRLLAQGSSTAEIAAQLGITPRTVRNHVQNILCKLHVHSRLEAVAYASARGFV